MANPLSPIGKRTTALAVSRIFLPFLLALSAAAFPIFAGAVVNPGQISGLGTSGLGLGNAISGGDPMQILSSGLNFGSGLSGILGGGAAGAAGGGGGGGEVPVKDQLLRQISDGIHQDTTALVQKEYVLNKIAKGLAQQDSEKVTASVLTNVTQGDNGGSRWVTNFRDLDQTTADAFTGNFILNQMQSIASPIQNDVILKVANDANISSYQVSSAPVGLENAFSSVADYNAFAAGTQGDFSWQKWYSFTQNPQNNPLGSYLLAKDAYSAGIADAVYRANQKVVNGFLPQETCVNTDPAGNCLDSLITTPAYTIGQSLSAALEHSQYDPLINPNDVDAVIGSVGNQIYDKVFSSGGSLLGLADGGSNSFINQLGNAAATGQNGSNPTSGGTPGGTTGGAPGTVGGLPLTKKNALAAMNTAMANLTTGPYVGNKQASIALMDTAIAGVVSIQTCYQNAIASTTITLSAANIAIAKQRIASSTDVIAQQLQPVRDTLAGDLEATTTVQTDLQGLIDQMTKAKKLTLVAAIFQSFQQFLSDNALGDLTGAQQLAAITSSVNSYMTGPVASALAQCAAFPPKGT